MKTPIFSLIACAVMLMLSPARGAAELIYDFRFSQPAYVVNPGSLVNVGLFLRETATGADVNRITNTVGITTGNVRVNWAGGGSQVNAATDAQFGAGFVGVSRTLGANNVVMQQLSLTGVTGTQVGAGIREVAMGSVTFTAPNTPGDLTNISFSDPSALTDLTIGSGAGTFPLDAIIRYGTGTIQTLAAVPEPGGLVLLALAGMFPMCRYGLRRWKARSRPS